MKYLTPILALSGLALITTGVGLAFGGPYALIAAGGLIWFDLTLFGVLEGKK